MFKHFLLHRTTRSYHLLLPRSPQIPGETYSLQVSKEWDYPFVVAKACQYKYFRCPFLTRQLRATPKAPVAYCKGFATIEFGMMSLQAARARASRGPALLVDKCCQRFHFQRSELRVERNRLGRAVATGTSTPPRSFFEILEKLPQTGDKVAVVVSLSSECIIFFQYQHSYTPPSTSSTLCMGHRFL